MRISSCENEQEKQPSAGGLAVVPCKKWSLRMRGIIRLFFHWQQTGRMLELNRYMLVYG